MLRLLLLTLLACFFITNLSGQSSFGFTLDVGLTRPDVASDDVAEPLTGYVLGADFVLNQRVGQVVNLRTGLGLGTISTGYFAAQRTGIQDVNEVYQRTNQLYLSVPFTVQIQPVANVPVYAVTTLRYRRTGSENTFTSQSEMPLLGGLPDQPDLLLARSGDFDRHVWQWEAGLGISRNNSDNLRSYFVELTVGRTLGNHVERTSDTNGFASYDATSGLYSAKLTIGRSF